jgi:hypothetical protein
VHTPHEAEQRPSLHMVKSALVDIMRGAEGSEGVLKRGDVIRRVLEQYPGATKKQVQNIFNVSLRHSSGGQRNPLAKFGFVLRAAAYSGYYTLVQCEGPAPRR